MKTKTLTDDRITTITNRFQKVYIVFMCIGTFVIIYKLSGISKKFPRLDSLQEIINLLLYTVLYIGLRLKTKWLIPLILISSVWWLLSTFLRGFQPAVDIIGLLAKTVGIMFVLFCAYQMYFFSRREVKSYFGTKETIFF